MTGPDEPTAPLSEVPAADPVEIELRVHTTATAEEVAGIRRAVLASAEAYGAGPALRTDIALAVSEACANVVMHAYLDAPAPGPLVVEAQRADGRFVVTVSDEGSGIAPRSHSPGLGLGLALIGRLTQRLEITNQDPVGARVTMTFAAAAA
jgi:serine/threonine-protein kinase RsbW